MRNYLLAVAPLALTAATPPPAPVAACTGTRAVASSHIIVQGGIRPSPINSQGVRLGGGMGMVSIGPKHDDPVDPHPNPSASGGMSMVSIGPKHDDPVNPHPTDPTSLGPKQDDPTPPPPADLGAMTACKVQPH